MEQRICKTTGCDKSLDYRNKSGFCGTCARLGKNNGRWSGGTTKEKPCTNCGRPRDYRSKSGLCRSCVVSGENNPFYGKNHTEETRERMSKAHETRPKDTYKGGSLPSEFVRAHRKRYWARFTKEERRRMMQELIELGQQHNKRSSKTKIEMTVSEILRELGVPHNQNIKIGPYYVDILLDESDVIIECFGDYWHCNPAIYDENYYNKSLHMTAKEKWAKDAQRILWLEAQGYKVIVLWGEDIRKKEEKVRATLTSHLVNLMDEYTE